MLPQNDPRPDLQNASPLALSSGHICIALGLNLGQK